jgi:hypothetical protein
MNKNVYIGSTDIDWNAIFEGTASLASSYLGYKTAQQQAKTPTSGGTTTIVNAPSGMSQTTKTLLIGGGILAAGLIIYAITKKK